MVLTKIGSNLSSLNDISSPLINVTSNNNVLIDQMHNTANTGSNGFLVLFILLAVSLFFYLILKDRSGLTDFGYSDLKALIISIGFSTIIGIVGVEAGVYQNYKTAVGFGTVFALLILLSMYNKSGEV